MAFGGYNVQRPSSVVDTTDVTDGPSNRQSVRDVDHLRLVKFNLIVQNLESFERSNSFDWRN